MREFVTHRFGAVEECNLRCPDAEGVEYFGEIAHLCHPLLVGGVRYDGSIGEEEEFVVSRHFRHGDMGEHVSLRQDAPFLVEHCAQQRGGVEQALHEHVGLSLPDQTYGLFGCFLM